ncbi:unnamed protein product [Triticum turgidum subsp. durum]|uniref:SH3 domain-containing protein n=1 Tax=Triticum turgidum subsp. durum TaxID=4567 RepID=A0A9R0S5L0_TRITD|nr:unnamed protein product [Triticum turgidum subsp. durum]
MEAVEAQQQQITFDRLLAMVDAERTYHQNVADILNKLHDEMLNARPHEESDNNDDVPSSDPSSEPKVSSPKVSPTHVHSNSISEDPALTETSEPTRNGQEVHYVGEVIHPFDGQADGELSISVGDFVVVRQGVSKRVVGRGVQRKGRLVPICVRRGEGQGPGKQGDRAWTSDCVIPLSSLVLNGCCPSSCFLPCT